MNLDTLAGRRTDPFSLLLSLSRLMVEFRLLLAVCLPPPPPLPEVILSPPLGAATAGAEVLMLWRYVLLKGAAALLPSRTVALPRMLTLLLYWWLCERAPPCWRCTEATLCCC